jgi:hypothetical protein
MKAMASEKGYSRGFLIGASRAIAITTLTVLAFSSGLVVGQSSAPGTASSASASRIRKSDPPQAGQETFPSAAGATQALVAALKDGDQASLLKVLGSNAMSIVSSGDDAEDKSNRDQFVQKYQQMHRLVIEPDGTTTLYIGAENWPTPIPLVQQGNSWYFDTAAGKQEILYRRIGKNELATIQVCSELVDAEKEYYGQSHDGDSNPQYAQKFFSDPGKHNGLYWETSAGEAASPIGPLLASAAIEDVREAADQKPQPFQGYYFRILKAEGTKAHGSERSFIVEGKMTRGFAFLAYPAEYRSSGVMSFIVDQDGIVYEKDLGPKTAQLAKTLTRYDRDASWRKAD